MAAWHSAHDTSDHLSAMDDHNEAAKAHRQAANRGWSVDVKAAKAMSSAARDSTDALAGDPKAKATKAAKEKADIERTWMTSAAKRQADADAAKKKAPPAEKPKLFRGRELNEHGHMDGLVPGQKLELRDRHKSAGAGGTHVKVLAGGKFEHKGKVYDGGWNMLSAIHGNNTHNTTVRRYFKLDGATKDKAEKAAHELSTLLKAHHVQVMVNGDNEITLMGDLTKAGVPRHMLPYEGAGNALLGADDAAGFIDHLRSERA
jgi:hypothetical protein